nr:DUF739 family protein [uncultured Anaerocolumna sp.]
MIRNPVFDYSKLRGRIVEKYGTQREFAKLNKMSDRSMSLKLNNGIGFSQEDIVRWCEMLDIDSSDIPIYFFKIKVS